jgi:hypothetical protein
MTRRDTAALLMLLAVSACARKGARRSDFDSAMALALSTHTPGLPAGVPGPVTPTVGHVAGFELTRRLNAHNFAVGGSVSQFSSGDSILLSVRGQDIKPGSEVSARIRQGAKTLDSAATTFAAADSSGAAIAGIRFGSAKPWARGNYQADIFLAGKFQLSQDFSVGQ